MTVRALILGILLASFIAVGTYFNDWVIEQSPLVGNHLPMGVFGILLLVLMAANPVLGRINKWCRLRVTELAFIAALGLAVCGWPGSSFFRVFVGYVALPAHDYKSQPAWQAADVMSYVPGGAPEVAAGHVRDWPELLQTLSNGNAADANPAAKRLWAGLNEQERRQFQSLKTRSVKASLEADEKRRVLKAINDTLIRPIDPKAELKPLCWAVAADQLPDKAADWLADRNQSLATAKSFDRQKETLASGGAAAERKLMRADWQSQWHGDQAEMATQRANRATLTALLPELILPAPTGDGNVLNGGRADPIATDVLVQGWDGKRPLGVMDLPWYAWWPVIRTWGSISILLTLAILCLTMIVHPQWSKRELLSYPTVKFFEQITHTEEGKLLPTMLRSKLFWISVSIIFGIHVLNGLQVWFPRYVPGIPLNFDFGGIRKLWPTAFRVPRSGPMLYPKILPIAIGFAFFLSKDISLSVGLSVPLWVLFGAVLMTNGVTVSGGTFDNGPSPMLRFGAFAGMAMIILYVGRTYYLNVLLSSVGARRHKSTPAYATWSFRVLIICVALAGAAMNAWAGLDWVMASLFIACLLVCSLCLARLNAENGVFFAQADWGATGVAISLLGVSAIGPEALAALVICGSLMLYATREITMPFLVNALNLAERVGKTPPRKSVWPIGGLIVVGFFLALSATLYWQYTSGCSVKDAWGRGSAKQHMGIVAKVVTELGARGELTESNEVEGAARIGRIQIDETAMTWAAVGLGFVLVCSVARLRLPWWPLHPVIFLMWGAWGTSQLAFSFIISWVIKSVVMRCGGAKGYRAVMPVMVGFIAGDLLASIGWAAVGAVYYFVTGTSPQVYSVIPR